jgi:hypothetical protein
MPTSDLFSRRDFFKSVGTAAGVAGLPAVAATEAFAQAAPSLSGLPETPASPFPTLNRRTLGWMRFLWEKSTTLDDWSSNGVPHPSAAALGMYLYDKVYDKQTHRSAQNFLEYARKNYVGVSADGKLECVTNYYDPIVQFKLNGPAGGTGMSTAFLLAPQNREFASFLYESAVNAAGYRAPNAQVRSNPGILLMARELADTAVADKLKAAADRDSDPRFFGKQNEMFGWWTNNSTEGYPRGQASATLMVSEIGRGGDWLRSFEAPHMDKFRAPTVEGVDFPSMGIYQAWNDPASGSLNVGTYAAAPDKRGANTSFKITNLANPSAVRISVDGQPFTRFEVTGPNSIRIDSAIENRQFRIVTGYRGPEQRADEQPRERDDRRAAKAAAGLASAERPAQADRQAARNLFSVQGPACACLSA